jgi:MATE family multidrug resistance protein
MIGTITYIYFSKIYVDTWGGWSWECLEYWSSYLKLGMPGVFVLIMEWIVFSIGQVVAGAKPFGTLELAVQSIMIDFFTFCYTVIFYISSGSGFYSNFVS